MNLVAKSRGTRRKRGLSAVEFALLLPVLVGLFLGTWSAGYSYYIYAELEQAVRGGTRYASLGAYQTSLPSVYTNAVKNAVVYGDPAGGTKPLVPGLLTSQVNVTLSPAVGRPTTVTVSISGYKLFGMYGGSFSLGGKPWLKLPFLGHYAPI